MKSKKWNNFMIYIFVIISMISVAGTGLEGPHLFDLYRTDTGVMHCFVESELLPEDNITNVKVVEPGKALLGMEKMRVARLLVSQRAALHSLLALAVLSGLFLYAAWEHFVLCSSRYLSKIGYQIVYIQAQDGRKRIS